MGSIKSGSSPAIQATIDEIERRADECYQSLALLRLPSNVALWALLTGAVQTVESVIREWSDESLNLSVALRNLGNFTPIAMKWAIQHGRPAVSPRSLDWTPELNQVVNQALGTASQYSHFVTCFPMWHRDRYAAELRSPDFVRFTVPGGSRQRQVSAYLKGFRPKEGSFRAVAAKRQKPPLVIEALFALSLQGALMTGFQSFRYQDPWVLWRELLPDYQGRVNAIARRNGALDLGGYTLAEFKLFYAAFLSICAAHEFLCYAWGQERQQYPLGSAIMVRPLCEWARLTSELSGLPPQKCESIIRDLTFDFTGSLDLHVHPFVPLGSAGELAVAPQFPLHSQMEENILRVCSVLRPQVYDAMSDEKEADMWSELQARLKALGPEGPIALPAPLPDIDLLLAEESSSTVVVAELKWSRKTLAPKEIPGKDAEVLKGISQLRAIAAFLKQNPDRLRSQGRLARRIDAYEHIYYLLIPRDHWPWFEPIDQTAIVQFDAFAKTIENSADLLSAIRSLLTYEWLPVDSRDFTVRYERATVNGVSLESEIFHPV